MQQLRGWEGGLLFTPSIPRPCEQQQHMCIFTADKFAVERALTHCQRSSCNEESCIASVFVKLPHGLSVINRPQGCHFHPTPNVY